MKENCKEDELNESDSQNLNLIECKLVKTPKPVKPKQESSDKDKVVKKVNAWEREGLTHYQRHELLERELMSHKELQRRTYLLRF